VFPLLEGPHVFVFWLSFIGAPLILSDSSSPNVRRIGDALLAAHVISLFFDATDVLTRIGRPGYGWRLGGRGCRNALPGLTFT
jgi:hypothetical protein